MLSLRRGSRRRTVVEADVAERSTGLDRLRHITTAACTAAAAVAVVHEGEKWIYESRRYTATARHF